MTTVTIQKGVPFNITTAVPEVTETSLVSVEPQFSQGADANKSIYLRLAATSSTDVSDYDTQIVRDKNSIHSFKTVQGTSGNSLWAFYSGATDTSVPNEIRLFIGVS